MIPFKGRRAMIKQKQRLKSVFFMFLATTVLVHFSLQPSEAAYFVTPSAYWQLEETDPGTEGILDEIGVVTGACANCPGGGVTGQIGNGFDFSTGNNEVVFTNHPVFDFAAGASFTIEFWMKRDGVNTPITGTEVMISRNDDTNDTVWWLGVNTDGTPAALFVDSDGPFSSTQLNGATNVADNIWHHIVVVRDGTADTLMMYVDGTLEGTADQSGHTRTDESFDSDSDVVLGRLIGSTFWFNGFLDNAAVYSATALSDEVILQNYLNGAQGRDLQEVFAPIFTGTVTDTIAVGFSANLQAQAAANPIPSFSSGNLPSGATIDSLGLITWLPNDAQTGSNAFSVTATNTQGSGSQNWNIEVLDLCTSNLETYWQLEEVEPGTEGINDETGVVDGTCTTCPGAGVTGQVGNGFDFSAGNSEVVFPSNPVFDFAAGASFTIELWMKRDGVNNPITGTEVMISRNDDTNETVWWLGVNTDGTPAALFVDSNGPFSGTQLNGTTNVANNIWHHIVVVRNGTADTLMMYVDGVLEGTEDQSGHTRTDESFVSTSEVTLGRLTGSTFWYGGALDEVALYNTALSATTVTQHTNASAGRYYCNAAPVISTTAPDTATEDTPYSYDANETDDEGDTVTWSLSNQPSGMTVDPSSGVVSWTPLEGVTTSGAVTLTADDGNGGTDSETFTIAVTQVNDNPEITTTSPTSATEGEAFSYDAEATDVDSVTLTWSLISPPTGMAVDPATGEVTWTPDTGTAGDYTFTLRVSDGAGGTDDEAITLSVAAGTTSSGGGGGGGCFIGSLGF
jgi:ureidoglycolate hydrolase